VFEQLVGQSISYISHDRANGVIIFSLCGSDHLHKVGGSLGTLHGKWCLPLSATPQACCLTLRLPCLFRAISPPIICCSNGHHGDHLSSFFFGGIGI
jgi:hypothetical protein